MTKETIYIEPSDDITDILSKLKASDKKIVALVPPKKPTVFLSSVNVKLIARTAKAEKKAVVLVSTDDALTKLAMAANLPVASSLKSRPVMPGEAPQTSDAPASKITTAGAESTAEPEDSPASKTKSKSKPEKSEKSEKPKKSQPAASGFKGFLLRNKLWLILGGIFFLALIAFLVWAFKFAPSVSLSVSVRTSSSNFSENVVFTTNPADEKVENSTFYLREETLEKSQVIKFTATGKKDFGERASGEVIVVAYFLDPGSLEIPADTKFSHGSFDYASTAAATLVGPAKKTASAYKTACNNYSDEDFEIGIDYCQVSVTVPVKAVAAGEDYNLSATNEGWTSSLSGLTILTRSDITGGTSRIVTVVQQSDVDLALDKMKSESSDNGKNELLAKLSNTVMPLEASFKIEASDPKVEPAVGEEVKEGVTPQISAQTTYRIFTLDNVRIEEFIKQKANVEDGKRLYSVGEPFIEYFSKTNDTTYSAKLKTTYKVGPEISETEILNKIQGEKLGRIEPLLKDTFSGVSSVKIEKSYFWVNSVPNDPNKVRVELTVEE